MKAQQLPGAVSTTLIRRRVARRALSLGFTLIELLVAISIMAVLALMSWRGLDAMSATQGRTRQRVDAVQALQAGLGQWNADWDALVAWPGDTPVLWNGKALRITRPSGSGVAEGVVVVAWSSRHIAGIKQWLRWQSPLLRGRAEVEAAWLIADRWAQNPTEDEKSGEVAIAPIVDWQVFYFRDNAWSNPFSTDGRASGQATTVPDGVRLVLTLPDGSSSNFRGNLTRDWVRHSVGGGKL